MDMDSGRVLEGSNIKKESLIASTTKILTAITAIEHGNLESKVRIGSEILKSFGSGIYVQIGEELTLDDLLYGLMLRSGNDAALAIAKDLGLTYDQMQSGVLGIEAIEHRLELKKYKDPDVRYYACVVDKNRAGAKPKVLFRLNLAYNIWEELGYLR